MFDTGEATPVRIKNLPFPCYFDKDAILDSIIQKSLSIALCLPIPCKRQDK
jgi:hypothetical protein